MLPELEPVEFPAWQPETRTEELALALSEGSELTVQQAVDAYALLNSEMPGATPSDLPVGEGFDATYALRLLDSVRDRLAPEQLAVLDAALHVGPADELAGTITLDGEPTGGPDATGPNGFAAGRPTSGARRQSARYVRLAQEMLTAWLSYRPQLPHRSAAIRMMARDIDGGGMDADLPSGTGGPCEIRVSKSFWNSSQSDDKVRFYFAHELFHCVQFGWFFGAGQPDWLIEGSADFAAADLMRGRYSPPAAVLSQGWFTRTNVGLGARSYNAWPLFENLRQSGGDPYAAIQAMVSAGGGSVESLLAVGQLDGVLFRQKWSSHTMRAPGLDETWQFSWPGPSPQAGPHRNSSSLGSRGVGAYEIRGVGGFTQVQAVVDIASPVGLLTVIPVGSPLTTHTGSSTIVAAEGSPLRLCFEADGCRCPQGTDSGAIRMSRRDVILSFAASAEAPRASAQAQRWEPDKECKRPDRRRGSSNGDPHLVTFDGLPYDVAALGEFVTARDPDGGFEVQARHVPAGFEVAGITAVAIGDGEHRVTFTYDDLDSIDPATVRVDGEITDESEFVAGSMSVRIDGEVVRAAWPDGTTAELSWTFGWFVSVSASAERASRLAGLLGAADGDFRNDLLMPDGAIVDPADASTPDSEFAAAWAVDESTSLFDYAPGESPATFRTEYPEGDPVLVTPEFRELCAGSIGAAATSHEVASCAFDLAATGQDAYVVAYEDVVVDRLEAIGGPTSATSAEAESPDIVAAGDASAALTLSGSLIAPYSPNALGSSAASVLSGAVIAGDAAVLVIRVELCQPDVTVWVEVTSIDRGDSTSVMACDPLGLASATADEDDEVIAGESYVWLSTGGAFNVSVDTDAEDAIAVSVDVFADQDPVVVATADLRDGDRTELAGAGDTVVYLLGLDDQSFTATGLETACVVEAYGAPEPGDGALWSLGYCGHDTGVFVGNAFATVPVVVFNREETPVTVELAPDPPA